VALLCVFAISSFPISWSCTIHRNKFGSLMQVKWMDGWFNMACVTHLFDAYPLAFKITVVVFLANLCDIICHARRSEWLEFCEVFFSFLLS
jgi:hypothetical protein